MMKQLGLGLAIVGWAVAASAQTMAPASPAAAEVRQHIRDLEQVWVTAENKHDVATLRSILDDKFVNTFGAGKLHDKEGFIAAVLSGEVDPTQSQTLSDQTVVVHGDTAVSVGTDTLSGTDMGKPYSKVFRYTVTYVHRDGRWVALAEHMVGVPPAK
jgi:ketosteroid isomerase-like protein